MNRFPETIQMIPSKRYCGIALMGFVLVCSRPCSGLQADQPAGVLLGHLNREPGAEGRSWLATQLAKVRDYPKLDLAFRLMKEGRTAEARQELDRMLARDPEDVRARSVYLMLLQGSHDYNGVVRMADAILKRYRSFAPALMYRGLSHQALGQPEKAIEDFTKLSELPNVDRGDRIFALDTLIELDLGEKRYSQALKVCDALTLFRQDFRLYYRKGLALMALGRSDEASRQFMIALDRGQDPGERLVTLRNIGDIQFRQGARKDAKGTYEAALKLNPRNPDLLRSVAVTAYEVGDYPEASRTMGQLVSLQPGPQDRLYLANIFLAQKNFAAAEQQFRVVLDESTNRTTLVQAYRATIELSRRRADLAEAVRLTRALLQLGPSQQDWRTLMLLLEEQRDYPVMIRELEAVLSQNNPDAAVRFDAFMRLGNVYVGLHRYENAEAAFTGAVRIRRDANSLVALALVLEEEGKIKAAVESTKAASDLAHDPGLKVRLAALYEKNGELEKALDSLTSAGPGGAPPDVRETIYRKQGYLLARMKRNREAYDAFVQALRLNPDDVQLNVAAAEICIELREFANALPWLEHAQAQGAASTSANIPAATITKMLALAYSESGNLENGSAMWQDLLARTPRPSAEAAEIDLSLAYLAIRRDSFGLAGKYFLEAFEDGARQNTALLEEAAQQFFRAQDWKPAADAFIRYFQNPAGPRETRARAAENLAFAYTKLGDRHGAVAALRSAVQIGGARPELRRNLAFAYYDTGEWKLSLDEFLAALGNQQNAQLEVGVARCYQHLDKPGLAIHYFDLALRHGLNAAELKPVLTDLAFAYESVNEYASAAQMWVQLLSLNDDAAVRFRLSRLLRLDGRFAEADAALRQVNAAQLPDTDRVAYLDERALAMAREGDVKGAVRLLEEANAAAPLGWRDYQLGLWAKDAKDMPEAIGKFRAALKREPDNQQYLQAFAYTLEASGDQKAAAQAFEELARRDPANVQWYKALGYVDMRLGQNAESAGWFRRAIDAGVAGGDQSVAENYALRSEISRLTNNFAFTYYHGYESNNLTRTGAIDLVGATPFPAPSGIEASYQPPRIGLRNGRTLQVFARLLWSSNHNSLLFDPKYYQSSIGVRYKPLPAQNLWVSAERLLHTGYPANGRWLARALYSWNPGFEVKPGRRNWNYTLAFSDTAYSFGGGRIFAQYGESRRGVTLNFRNRLLLTPHVVGDARWQSGQFLSGSYVEGGMGVSLRYLFNETRYEIQRSSFEVLFQCKWGGLFGPQSGINSPRLSYSGCAATGIYRFGS
jgi:tetratricopeptide (TPR) repeat protein